MPQDPNQTSEYLESPSNQRPGYEEDEIDLRELIKVLWKGKFWIIGTTFIAAVTSVAVALWLPNIYLSEALLAVDEERNSPLSGLASQYGGLASLAGINLPMGAETSQKNIGIATLQSRQFISNFIERHNILPELMAVKTYDINTGELSYDPRSYDAEAGTWVRDVRPPLRKEPSLQEAYLAMIEILDVNEDLETGFVTVSIEHPSPLVSYEWVTWLVDDLNRELMLEAIDEAQQSIDYLTEQLTSTQIVALEQVFYSLIEEQTKTIMLANSRPEYLFKTIDPAINPERKFRPNRALICILSTLFGGVLGVVGVTLRRYSFGTREHA